MFHKTFLSIMRGEDSLDKIYNKLTRNGVSTMNFDILPKNADTVITSAPFLLQSIKREQELIETNKDYYVARDILTNTYYICYNNVLMLDVDTTSNIDDVLTKLEQETDKCFSIYKSHNGYHIFCLSHRFEYRDKSTCEFMLKYDCDFYYTVYTYIRGFSVRLNKKFTENENEQLYEFVGYVGNKDNIDVKLKRLVQKHIDLSIKYKQTINLQNFFI